MKLTQEQKDVLLVIDRIKQLVMDNPDEAGMWAGTLDDVCDDLQGMDAFGTEGQMDPRGDFRDGNWELSSGNLQIKQG